MRTAWQFVKVNGFTMSEALKQAWLNIKLAIAMKTQIVQFYYRKLNGEMRQAFGTTDKSRYDYTPVGGGRRHNPQDCFQYWDTVKGAFRMFKTYNLVSIIL